MVLDRLPRRRSSAAAGSRLWVPGPCGASSASRGPVSVLFPARAQTAARMWRRPSPRATAKNDAIADAIWNLDGVVLGPFDPFPAFSGLVKRLAASSTPSVLISGQGGGAGSAPCLYVRQKLSLHV